MPESGRITATLDVLPRAGGSVKVRLTIWSGEDFRFSHIRRGAIFEDGDAAEAAAEEIAQALDLIGIPIEGREPARDARLPTIGEAQEYPRV